MGSDGFVYLCCHAVVPALQLFLAANVLMFKYDNQTLRVKMFDKNVCSIFSQTLFYFDPKVSIKSMRSD